MTDEKVNVVKFASIDKHLANIETTLERMAANFEQLSRIDERMLAHEKADAIVHEVVATTVLRVNSLDTKIGPLIEMRRWIVAGVVGLLGTFTAAAFNAVSNHIYNVDQARAIPAATKRIEEVLSTPQPERKEKVEEIRRADEKAK